MRLFNTLSGKVEEFKPNVEGKVAMYTCGPTVYHFAHIGNLRSYLMEDVLEKTLRYSGYDVKRVMNITDVGHLSSDADEGEDKMLKGAKREHKTVMEIAKFYTDAFFADCKKLNIKTPDVIEPATNCIDEFINMISMHIRQAKIYILTLQSLIAITYSAISQKMNLWWAFVTMLPKTQIRKIKTILSSGSQSLNLKTRH